jgi:hypothetical protein
MRRMILSDVAPSVITYDYEERKQVRQDRRVWVAGLSDEAVPVAGWGLS